MLYIELETGKTSQKENSDKNILQWKRSFSWRESTGRYHFKRYHLWFNTFPTEGIWRTLV